MEFKGCRALVTGASSGMGEVFARELARRGADLVLAARSRGKLEALASELRASAHVTVQVEAADLSEPGAGQALADRLAEQDLRIDVLVNNAGFGLFGPLHEADGQRIAQAVRLNVAAPTELTCSLLPGMRARDRGAIVNVASTAAFQPVPYMAVYGATKAYVLSFTEALWAETRGTGVHVTALCPGATDTAFFDTASDSAPGAAADGRAAGRAPNAVRPPGLAGAELGEPQVGRADLAQFPPAPAARGQRP